MKAGMISLLALIIVMVIVSSNERPALSANADTQRLCHTQQKANYQKAQMIPGIRNAFKF